MTAFSKKPRCDRDPPSPEGRTFCRIVGEEKGSDGKTRFLLESITDPREQEEARKRYEATMRRVFNRLKINSTAKTNLGRRE
jgi:hypothetical protein